MTQYQVSTSGPLVMKLIALGILLHHFVHFAGKNGVYENTLHLMQGEVTNNKIYTPIMINICKNSNYLCFTNGHVINSAL